MSSFYTAKRKQMLLQALHNSFGNITIACAEAKVPRKVFYDWLKKDPDFKERYEAIDDYTIDFVESQLLKKIKEGDRASILFFMKHKGRKRGYTESITTDVNITMEQPLLEPLNKKENE
jgi:hypothetical protein